MPVTVQPLFKDDKPHFHTSGGSLAVGYRIYTYLAGTSTPVAMYTSPSATTVYENPIVLDGRGEPSGQGIYADPSLSYKVILKTPDDAVIWSMDDVKCAGVGETSNEKEYFILHQPPVTGVSVINSMTKLMFESPDHIEYLSKSDNFDIDYDNREVVGLSPTKRYFVSINVFYSVFARQDLYPTIPARIEINSSQSSTTDFYSIAAPVQLNSAGFISSSYVMTGKDSLYVYGSLKEPPASGQSDHLYLYDLQIAEV